MGIGYIYVYIYVYIYKGHHNTNYKQTTTCRNNQWESRIASEFALVKMLQNDHVLSNRCWWSLADYPVVAEVFPPKCGNDYGSPVCSNEPISLCVGVRRKNLRPSNRPTGIEIIQRFKGHISYNPVRHLTLRARYFWSPSNAHSDPGNSIVPMTTLITQTTLKRRKTRVK